MTNDQIKSGGELLERWPGYNEQSWSERFAELDRQHKDLRHKVALNFSRTPAKVGEDGDHIADAGKRLREAAQPFLDLLAGVKPTAPLYEIPLPIYPEGSGHPYDWRARIIALRDALSSIEEPRG